MCIAILKKADVHILDEVLQECWNCNNDGAGFMFAEKGKLHIHKGYFSFEQFMENYYPHRTKQCVIHFRIKTHGLIDEENCHPYSIDDNLAFVHNGIIYEVDRNKDDTKSDTWHFNENFLKPLRRDDKSFFKEPIKKTLIEKFISGSKLIFLNSKGDYEIYNEDAGNWDSDCWFSNRSWVIPTKSTYQPPHHQGYTSYNQPSDNTLKTGDVCWMIMDDGAFNTGDYVIVDRVIDFGNVIVHDDAWPAFQQIVSLASLQKTQIITPKKENIVYLPRQEEVPAANDEMLYHFEIGKEAVFVSNWNHFRDGDEVMIERILDKKILCTSLDNNKRYMVPIEKIEPVEQYLFNLDKGIKNARLQ